ncbi:MAG: helix-turn-helix domain-containing protein [Desertifilum sp. SIO1I2]|nr:helix-turn-helix domain-containing protein [Desertifilum sp. SIO1I2]
MVSNSASYLSVAKGATSETLSAEVSAGADSPDLLALLGQIENQLYHSEVYRRCLKSLRGMLGETASNAQMLFKAIGREAIRLALHELNQYYANAEAGDRESSQPAIADRPAPSPAPQTWVALEEEPSTTAVAPQTTRVVPSTMPDILGSKPQKRLSKTELATQQAEQERQECLRSIGEQLRKARQARSLSLAQLHSQTLIPPHQLEALELGRVEQLPEDVYVRGFIRRISAVLGVDGQQLLATLPAPDPVRSAIPSWYHPPTTHQSGFYLNTVHLYLGYSALIAGAVGGLAWLSNQTAPDVGYEAEPIVPTDTANPNAQRDSGSKPGLRASQSGGIAGSDLAPPEMLPSF